VQIKLDAFDYSVYGMLSGKLTYISSDTLVEQAPNGQSTSSYRAQIKLDSVQANLALAKVALKPGMTATIDVKTRTRSVLPEAHGPTRTWTIQASFILASAGGGSSTRPSAA
ncbi:MAG: hypothetical protein EBS39_03580, partial [Gammaproteobacteria bacterium]|nr:hypothetical protein [Gammaproteobacteria bacterium]